MISPAFFNYKKLLKSDRIFEKKMGDRFLCFDRVPTLKGFIKMNQSTVGSLANYKLTDANLLKKLCFFGDKVLKFELPASVNGDTFKNMNYESTIGVTAPVSLNLDPKSVSILADESKKDTRASQLLF